MRASSSGGIFVFYCYGNSSSLETRNMYFWFLVLKSHVYRQIQLYGGFDGSFQFNCLKHCAVDPMLCCPDIHFRTEGCFNPGLGSAAVK